MARTLLRIFGVENAVAHHQQLTEVVTQLLTLERQHPARRLKVTVGVPKSWGLSAVEHDLRARLEQRSATRVAFELQHVAGACRILAYEFDVD